MGIDRILLALAVVLTATVVAGGIAKKLNLGSTVALLAVGVALGPHSPWPIFTGQVEDLQTVGEIGVMLLFFLVGLDLRPQNLSAMRRLFVGLGTAQYLLTSTAIAALLIVVASMHWQAALIVALGLAISSDAVVIPSLEEHAETGSSRGRAVVAVLIYQSLAVIPVLALAARVGYQECRAPGDRPRRPSKRVEQAHDGPS